MTELPDPLTPHDCDIRKYAWLPLSPSVLKGSKTWLRCKRNPALAFYHINLWTASWCQIPAASLEDDDDYLCDLAQCDPDAWPGVRNAVLSGWIKCSDGRLYHAYVAEEALKAFAILLKGEEKRGKDRVRLQEWRDAKAAKRTANVTSSETVDETRTQHVRNGGETSNTIPTIQTEPTEKDIPPPPKQPGAVKAGRRKIIDSTEFESFYSQYPLAADKGIARVEFVRARKKVSFETIMRGMQTFDWPEDPKWLKKPGNWLKGECWGNVTPAATPAPATPKISARKEAILRAGGLWNDQAAPIIDADPDERLLIQ
jgi:hypothetical protein